jgi:hypothetical protein
MIALNAVIQLQEGEPGGGRGTHDREDARTEIGSKHDPLRWSEVRALREIRLPIYHEAVPKPHSAAALACGARKRSWGGETQRGRATPIRRG